ncbi:hypothetical protein F5B19DRAFT_488125 [Rostrohypoxylon terebratum]|nr:hypothetical protein F5B19DRAFT_488125 [Rostrohypoxylon terebratum]
MAPGGAQNKTNFRTYEASTRLLAAVLATAKPKLNFADPSISSQNVPFHHPSRLFLGLMLATELAEYVGGGTTGPAIEHRFRPIKQLAKMQIAYKEAKMDPGNLPAEPSEIQRLFGESTAGGIEWQFRDIKALGRAQELAVEEERNPAELKVGPSRPKHGATPPSTMKKAGGSASTGAKRKRGGKALPGRMSDEDEGDDSESDYDAKDVKSEEEKETPASKRRNTGAKASASKKKNNNNGEVARTLFPRSRGKNSARGSGSVFGNGDDIGSKNNAQVIDDSDDDDMAGGGRASQQRPRRVKKEEEEEEEEEEPAAAEPRAVEGLANDDSAYSNNEFTDGEV